MQMVHSKDMLGTQAAQKEAFFGQFLTNFEM